jgi:hypothetical protein
MNLGLKESEVNCIDYQMYSNQTQNSTLIVSYVQCIFLSVYT